MSTGQEFLYLEIAESIRRLIASRELKPGDRLPSVRQMAERWNCTPGTVNRAYTQLAQDNLVEARRGSGTRVRQGALQMEQPSLQYAALVNRAEQYLLGAIGSGHSASQAQAALSLAISRWQDLQQHELPAAQPAGPAISAGSLRYVGSHDLLIETLAQMLAEQAPHTQLAWEYTGSLGGLIALAQNKADLAGTHLWDETTDSYNLPFVRRLLPGRQVILLTLALRSMGLLLPAGNPQEIHTIADLAHRPVRLVNRQRGSGTRVWFDAQLKAAGIHGESLPGYDREELTHLAVARLIAEDQATVGLGIHAVAAAYRLDFVPLTQERYELVFPRHVWDTAEARELVELIRSAVFKDTVVALGGYDTAETGRERWVS